MDWIEFSIQTSTEASDALIERLVQLGAAGIASVNPDEIINEIIPILQEDKTTVVDDLDQYKTSKVAILNAYFAIDDGVAYNEDSKLAEYSDFDSELAYKDGNVPSGRLELQDFLYRLQEEINFIGQFLDVSPGIVTYEIVDELSWRDKWKETYQSFQLTDSFFVQPTWDDEDLEDAKYTIKLDPGTAFGTGTHPTTMSSAKMLEKYLEEGVEVLDLGTGSGILAIVASKLGAKFIDAIDIDGNAILTAIENARQNSSLENIDFREAVITDVEKTYDLIVANLTANLHLETFEEYVGHSKPGTILILSGIIEAKADQVMSALAKTKFKYLEKLVVNDWHTIVYSLMHE